MDKENYKDKIGKLITELAEKQRYITVLENKVQELETENYFIKRNKYMEDKQEERLEEDRFNQIKEGLDSMGMTSEDLDELGDLLDEALGKEDDKDV